MQERITLSDPNILFLNCGAMTPPLAHLQAVSLCLALETDDGWVLVDTGFGTRDFTSPTRRMRLWRAIFGIAPQESQAAIHQLAGHGISSQDLRHIVLTHLHFDHAGGLRDFPSAQVHVARREAQASRHPRKLLELGYLPAHWAHGPRWVIHEPGSLSWQGKPAVRVLPGVRPEILLVSLPGHTSGHCGVVVETGRGWLLLAGDAASPFHPYGDVGEARRPSYPLGWFPTPLVRWILGPHTPWMRELAARNRETIEIVSSHDVQAWERHNPRQATLDTS